MGFNLFLVAGVPFNSDKASVTIPAFRVYQNTDERLVWRVFNVYVTIYFINKLKVVEK